MSLVVSMPDSDDDNEGLMTKVIIGVVIAALLGAVIWWGVHAMGQSHSGPKRQTVKIAVLSDTPPPPPPPPKEKPPEPEKQELKPQMQQEQVKPQEAPPAPAQLKMDGPAGDGPSAFAAGQVATEYKGGEIGFGNGGNRLQFALFTNKLTRHIQLALSKNKDVKFDFRVSVQVWLGANGAFQKVVLDSSTGDPQMDATLRSALTHLPPIDGVPGNLPQPLLLRITNRLTG